MDPQNTNPDPIVPTDVQHTDTTVPAELPTVETAEEHVAAANPETIKEETAEFNQEVTEEAAALPTEANEVPAVESAPEAEATPESTSEQSETPAA